MNKIFYTDIFARISPMKQSHILDIAVKEFANKGFKNSNINIIAEKAGVSVGSLYKYFETKENLFLASAHFGIFKLEGVLNEITQSDLSFFDKFEALFRILQKDAQKSPDLHRLYNELTSESYSDVIRQISSSMESLSAKTCTQFIIDAKKEGLISSDIDEKVFAWCIDNLLVCFQFSFSCDYYKDRLKIYLGEDILDKEDYLIQQVMTFIRRAFSPNKEGS